MIDVLEFYQKQALAGLSDIPWLKRLQHGALTDFTRIGFPGRHDEEWKYTSVDAFLRQRFNLNQPSGNEACPPMNDVPLGLPVRICNGKVLNAEEVNARLPAGVIVKPWPQAIGEHADLIKPHLGQILSHEHGFQALNTAILQDGLFIYLPEGCQLKDPLWLSHWQDNAEQAVYLRYLIVAGAGSSATVVEDYQGLNDCAYLSNAMSEIAVGKKALLNHYKIQREGNLAYHVGHTAVRQAGNSGFNSHVLSLGGKLVRSDVSIVFREPHAHCLLNGIYVPVGGQHIDHHTTVAHAAPFCHSEQDYKGILKGASRAVFNGKVLVAKDAQHTVAKQQNKNLLLSAAAEIDTKPQLEIYADDVVCSHGATVGQLDEDALFYLAARGINREEASRYMIQAFSAENLQRVSLPGLQDWMKSLLNRQLG
ncbi:Fe-S cluster assembly protein SufD [Legionella londiniensis]|uniref:ABC transporter permease n=1 Tax=Legionella londiniensis TaxID=45068 RepID=A0A0W0VKR3_9GAMM|nr:Fe-S cluster assembly protein SufD [Legionella londiniensis]KTD20695.1 ABC transporter permease [Legionella londiniensis]STX92832.1 ABC transporter permease [Legionella londiniensis]